MKRSGRRRRRTRTRAGTAHRRPASNPEAANQSIFAPPTPRTGIPFEIAGEHDLESEETPLPLDDHAWSAEPATMDPSAEELLSHAARTLERGRTYVSTVGRHLQTQVGFRCIY